MTTADAAADGREAITIASSLPQPGSGDPAELVGDTIGLEEHELRHRLATASRGALRKA
jgi:hypothetical protein